MLISLFPSSVAHAAGNDVSSNVTSVSVSPGNINDGEKTTFKMSYDDHAQKIKGGDTITVSWPSSGTVYGEGYSKTIDLYIDGVNVGVLKVTPQNAVITFNSNINDVENVHGWAEFDIEGRNLANTSDENTGSFTITSGGYSTSVSVTKPKSGTVGVFYYKTGDMQPDDTDHVRWFLNMNNEKAYVDDRIYVTDQIQPGQTLDPKSFDITVEGYNPGHFDGADAIAKFEQAYPGASISADASTGKIIVSIPQDQANLNSFSVMYLTSVDDYNAKEFKNNSQAWYHEHNKDAVNGKEFDHTVQNVNANGGIDGTNQTSVSVKKVWKDNDDSRHKRPANVQVQLLANGYKTGSPVTLDASNSWSHTWEKLVKNAKGAPIKYTLEEVSVPSGYQDHFALDPTGVNAFTLTNTYKQVEKIDFSGEKVWKDSDNQDGIRPSSVTITLLQNGKDYLTTQTNAAQGWKYSFKGVPKTDDKGKAYSYSVKETPVNGYTSAVDGYTITNTHKTKTINICGKKVWDDANNQDGKRPQSVTINLLANGVKVKSATATAATQWGYIFKDLPEFAKGQKISYTVTENAVAGYTATVSGSAADGFTITNKHTPAVTSLSGSKTWNDKDDQDGKRPGSITVNLLADGQKVKSVKATAAGGWKYSFADVPVYANGRKIVYTVSEDPVKGYTTAIDGFDITNTRTPVVPPTPSKPSKPTTPTSPATPRKPSKPVTPRHPVLAKTGVNATVFAIASLALLLTAGVALSLRKRME